MKPSLHKSRLQGGAPGQVGRNWLIRLDGTKQSLAGCVSIEVQTGESIRIETPGGGGFACPVNQPPS